MKVEAQRNQQPSPLYRRALHYFFVRLPVYLLIICIGYVLSIGPLFWTWHRATFLGRGNEYITQIYYPLALVCQYSEPVSKWINKYIDFWVL